MLENESDTVKLFGMHDQLFAGNAELVRIYGEFAPRITADGTELEALVQHNDMNIEMLADIHSEMVLLYPPLERTPRAPVAKFTYCNQETMLTAGDP